MLAMPSPRRTLPRAVRVRFVKSTAQGFTLIELMVVVIIMGILATLATYGVRKYVLEAKKAEATAMLTQIRAAEEAYRDETFNYLGLDDYSAWHPLDEPGDGKYSWGAETALRTAVFDPLGVQPDGPVRYAYSVVIGNAGVAVPAPPSSRTFDFGTPPTAWYVAIAKADLNGDGRFTYALSYSGSSEIVVDDTF
jgi:prepilin-type N-terminal cleavage/methylation domain-containing protein